MADNVAVTAGTGTSIAADEVADATLGTVKVQYVKLMDGTLDGTNKAAVGANGLAVPVVDGGDVAQGAKADAAYTGSGSASVIALLKAAYNATTALARSFYTSPNGNKVQTGTSLDSLFSDDFGGVAINTANWDVLDGGLAANVNLGSGVLTQAKIGSGTTGITDAVSASGLTVSMGTTLGAERWYLSKQAFAGKEDVLVLISKSQALAANSIFIGLVEVDPTTLVPLLNPNFAADGNGSSEFTNRGGVELGLTTTTNLFSAEAIGDSSSSKAVGGVGTAGNPWSVTQECLLEIDSRDITVSTANIDAVTAKSANASRVSSQCPHHKKLYKMVMRFKTVSTPGSNTHVVVQRALVVDNYEQRVQMSTGEGDQIASKAVPVNFVSGAQVTTSAASMTALSPNTGQGASTFHKLTSAATTNGTSVKASQGVISGGYVRNRAATEKYFKLYNKASAPTVGTDTPVMTIGIPAADKIMLADVVGAYGLRLSTGIAYAITGAYPDADTTAVVASDVDVNILYS